MEEMRLFGGVTGGRLGFAATFVVSVFIFVSALMPSTHHSLDCHLRILRALHGVQRHVGCEGPSCAGGARGRPAE